MALEPTRRRDETVDTKRERQRDRPYHVRMKSANLGSAAIFSSGLTASSKNTSLIFLSFLPFFSAAAGSAAGVGAGAGGAAPAAPFVTSAMRSSNDADSALGSAPTGGAPFVGGNAPGGGAPKPGRWGRPELPGMLPGRGGYAGGKAWPGGNCGAPGGGNCWPGRKGGAAAPGGAPKG